MPEITDKASLLQNIRLERQKLENLIGKTPTQELAAVPIENEWTIKDILVHITAWERLMVNWVEESLRGEIPDRPSPGTDWDDLDGLNERIFLQNRERSLDDVMADFAQSYQRVLKVTEGLTQDDLFNPDRFAWRNGDPLWNMVAANTCWHYKEHAETIENWRHSADAG